MIAAALIILSFVGLVIVPCLIGLYIRSSIQPIAARRPSGS
jgi:hypothetical protein